MNRRQFFKGIAAAGAAAMLPISIPTGFKTGPQSPLGVTGATGPGDAGHPNVGITGCCGEEKVEPPDNAMEQAYFYLDRKPIDRPVDFVLDGFCPRKGLMTRYSKKKLREGAKFYAKLSIKDFVV